MNILYLSFSWLPSRRANSVHVMKMADAFAGLGHDVTLVAKRSNEDTGPADDYADYGVEPRFEIVKLRRPARRGGEIVYWAGIVRLLFKKRLSRIERPDLVYCRYLPGAVTAAALGLPVVYETHGLPQNRLHAVLLGYLFKRRALRRLVLISEALRTDFERYGRLPKHVDTLVAHDAADLSGWQETEGDPPDERLVDPATHHIGYVGSLYSGRGFELMAELAKAMEDCTFHIVGGNDRELRRLRSHSLPANLILHGFVRPSQLPRYYRHFDVLLMPYQDQVQVSSGKLDISAWMSPMKMFEYMASDKPIVSSDLPVLREVLEDGHNALLVPPDDVASWRRAVRRLLEDGHLSRRLASTARKEVAEHHTWAGRARRVLPQA